MLKYYILIGIFLLLIACITILGVFTQRTKPETRAEKYARIRKKIGPQMGSFGVAVGDSAPPWNSSEITAYSSEDLGLNDPGGAWDAR